MTKPFSSHVLEKMRARVVTKQQVEEAINNPDSNYEDTETKVSVAVKKITNMNLIVIYVSAGKNVRVVTVFHASEIDRLIKRKLDALPQIFDFSTEGINSRTDALVHLVNSRFYSRNVSF